MAKEALVLLQSGFVAIHTGALTKEEVMDKSIQDQLVSKSVFQPDMVGRYDVDVEALCDRLMGNQNAVGNFEYRESVLRKAIAVFNDEGAIGGWFNCQKSSPTLTYLHKRFLMETLDYVYNGKPRRLSLTTYRRLLFIGTNSDQHAIADKDSDYIDLSAALKNLDSISMSTFLQNWTATPEGIQDLVGTLDVIFGRRKTPGL